MQGNRSSPGFLELDFQGRASRGEAREGLKSPHKALLTKRNRLRLGDSCLTSAIMISVLYSTSWIASAESDKID